MSEAPPPRDHAPVVREGQGSTKITRPEFEARWRAQFYDPAFEDVSGALDEAVEIAWQAYRRYLLQK